MNGQGEFVGSNRAKQSSQLEKVLQEAAIAGVEIKVSAPSPASRTVTYTLDGALDNAVLNVALVSKIAVTQVSRGENVGSKLVHNNVVRAFQTVLASPNSTVTLTLPNGFDPANGAIVAYVQGQKGLEIRGASQVNVQ